MFLPWFLVFTLIFTLFENIVIAGGSLGIILLLLCIYQVIIKKKILLWRSIVFVVVAFVVAGVSFGVKEWRYYLTPTPLLKIGEGLKSSGALHHPSFIKEDKSSASPSFGTSLNPFPQNVGPFTLTTQSTSLQ